MNAGPFRIGVVGAGRMGRVHLAALGRSAHVEVVAVVEPVDAILGDLSSAPTAAGSRWTWACTSSTRPGG